MARSWTLVETLTLSFFAANVKRAVVISGTVYFIAGARSGVGYKIYSWNPTDSFTDISGSSFPLDFDGTNFGLSDICAFGGDLFCLYGPTSTTGAWDVYRWTGGTSWTSEETLLDESLGNCQAVTGTDFNMDADAFHMFISTYQAGVGGDGRLFARNSAGAYSLVEMPGSTYSDPAPELVGLSKGSQYGSVITNNLTGAATYRTVQDGGPSPFSNLSGFNIGDRHLIGYADGYSFYTIEASAGTWEIRRSLNWGVNLSTAGGVSNDSDAHLGFGFKDIGSGVVMLCDTQDNQAYTWDSDTIEFVADGTIDSGSIIIDYFLIGSTLYALAEGSSVTEIEVWEGGQIACASFYYGIEIPSLAGSLPICGVSPGAILIDRRTGLVILGANQAGPMSVIRAPIPYDEWFDISGPVPTGTAVTSIKGL